MTNILKYNFLTLIKIIVQITNCDCCLICQQMSVVTFCPTLVLNIPNYIILLIYINHHQLFKKICLYLKRNMSMTRKMIGTAIYNR